MAVTGSNTLDDPAAVLAQDGYALLRDAVPREWRGELCSAFEAGVGSGDQWAAPRGPGWRHALVDLDPMVHAACRLPVLLATVGALLGAPFFLCQVEGREPLPGGGHQPLHRDGAGMAAVSALIFLDAYGPDNGATRLVPRSRGAGGTGEPDEVLALTLAGEAGDIIVFDADLLHGAGTNRSGARRRSLLLTYAAERHRDEQEALRAIRNVRMDRSETFAP